MMLSATATAEHRGLTGSGSGRSSLKRATAGSMVSVQPSPSWRRWRRPGLGPRLGRAAEAKAQGQQVPAGAAAQAVLVEEAAAALALGEAAVRVEDPLAGHGAHGGRDEAPRAGENL